MPTNTIPPVTPKLIEQMRQEMSLDDRAKSVWNIIDGFTAPPIPTPAPDRYLLLVSQELTSIDSANDSKAFQDAITSTFGFLGTDCVIYHDPAYDSIYGPLKSLTGWLLGHYPKENLRPIELLVEAGIPHHCIVTPGLETIAQIIHRTFDESNQSIRRAA